MPKTERKSTPVFENPKTTLRDATLEDIPGLTARTNHCAIKFFGDHNLELKFRSAVYSIIIEYESGKIAAYANFENAPNISALSKGFWLHWMRFHYGMPNITYGNTLFLTFFITDDPYNSNIISDIFREVFLREPKLKFICTVAPPNDSIYEDILEVHCKQIFSLNKSSNRLSQSIFVCEKCDIVPKMRLRLVLVEDNDDLVEIIDEKLKTVRQELGDYYIAEQVLRNDPSENIIVAEISNVTIGMIWVNTNIDRKALADNFEIAAYGNFLKPQQVMSENINTRTVVDVIRKRSEIFFDKTHSPPFPKEKIPSDENRMSLNNLYISSSESSQASQEFDNDPQRNLFQKWQTISKNLKTSRNYTDEVQKTVKMPKTTEMTNAFAIQLFGLSSSIDPRRIFDLVAAAFASYPDKDYCVISLSSSEASSDTFSGPLLRYFSRVIPHPGCKISDCLYVTHKNSFLTEIEVNYLTQQDVADVESLLCLTSFQGEGMFYLADITQIIGDYLDNPWSSYDILIIRCAGCPIGFAILKQNCVMCELRTNYVLYEDDDAFPDWEMGELKYLHLHPAFVWEWVHVTREIFRLTGYFSMHHRLIREYNQPILNSILLNMFPIFPRKRVYGTHIEPYALYYLNIRMCHMVRDQIENKLVIIGFNETCKGFLRTLIFSPNAKHMQCPNITVITDCPGFIEAEYDLKSFEKQHSLFFQAKNQFNADYLRRLEFRTWVRFIGGKLKGINGDAKRLLLDNGTTVHYDRLYLMCSSRYSVPKLLPSVPSNYLELNGRLDKIIFYHKIRLLAMEVTEPSLQILIYGTVVMAHSCLNTLIELGIGSSQICLLIPQTKEKIDFPETFDDEYLLDLINKKEQEAGVKIYKNLKFIDWNVHPQDDTIESVIFESDFERISLKCLAFICFHGEALSDQLRDTLESQNVKLMNNKIVIDQNSKTNVPDVYACGRITEYQEKLFAKQIEQRFFNQIEIGNQLAVNFIKERRTGKEQNMLEVSFVKPIFRQSQLIDGLVYGGLRKPGRYVPRDIRKSLGNYGLDLVTRDDKGEYCRVGLDKNGFISEITCLTRKYNNLEVLYRIYGLHETLFNNMKTRCECGDIENLLDFFHEDSFSVVIHDQFLLLRQAIRKKNVDCLEDFLKNRDKINKNEIQQYLKDRGMHESMEKDLISFITKHWKSLHPHYALPDDFPK